MCKNLSHVDPYPQNSSTEVTLIHQLLLCKWRLVLGLHCVHRLTRRQRQSNIFSFQRRWREKLEILVEWGRGFSEHSQLFELNVVGLIPKQLFKPSSCCSLNGFTNSQFWIFNQFRTVFSHGSTPSILKIGLFCIHNFGQILLPLLYKSLFEAISAPVIPKS